MAHTSKIEVSIPRDDEKRFCDLLHLNGFTTEVSRPEGRPVVILIAIQPEQFEGDVVEQAFSNAVAVA
jgi:hypothetical protein